MRRSFVAAVSAGLVLLGAASANADEMTLGSGLDRPSEGGVCNANCLAFQKVLLGGTSPNKVVPYVNGVITQWKVRTSDPGTLYTLWVLRSVGGDSYTGTARVSAPQPTPVGATDQVFTYPGLNTPIGPQDSIGLLQTGAAAQGLPQYTHPGATADTIGVNPFGEQMTIGGAAAFPSVDQRELLLQATIKYCYVPDIPRMKRAQAVRIIRASDCTPKVKRVRTRNPRLVGRVLRTKPTAGYTAVPGSRVKLEIGRAPR